MANTLTNLIPIMYQGLDVVSREMVGFTQAVSLNASAQSAALNETINIPIVGAVTGGDITPGQTPPDTGDATPGNTTMTISKSRYFPIRWNGEEQMAVGNTGIYDKVNADRFAQAIRAAVNEVETDLAALHTLASRAAGTAGTTPFGTANDLTAMSNAMRILDDNGAGGNDYHAVFGSATMANLRGKQSVLFKVNEAGTDDLLRRGIIGDIFGTMIHNSGQVNTSTAGTGSSATTNTAGYAIGATTITLASAGTGTIVTGDVITFAGDTNQYVVLTGDADVSGGGTVVLAEPGLKKAIAASATAITVTAASERNMVFAKSAISLATRAPAMPMGGDTASDVTTITDPQSGLTFQVAEYKEYRQVRYELGLAWGVKLVAPRHCALLLG